MARIEEFSSRAEEILAAVISEYISTAEPVGSKAIAERYGIGLSPASIRKIMSELEERGLLTHPHTSAGRVPTEKSFHHYVDSLLRVEAVLEGDMELIRTRTSGAGSLEDALREAGRALSNLTRSAVMVTAERGKGFVIKSLKVVRVDRSSLMVIAVSLDGAVQSMLARLPEADIERIDLVRVSNYLNAIGAGLTLAALRRKLLSEMADEKNLCDEIVARALKLGMAAFSGKGGGEREDTCYVEGRANIFDQFEFGEDLTKMKRVFNIFEEKSLLVKILDRCIEDKGLKIQLGSESDVTGLDGISFVAAPYSSDDGVEGTLCVVGPVWMNYPRIVPLVRYTAGLLCRD